MSDPVNEMIVEFIKESKDIIVDLTEALNHAEAGTKQAAHLETYGQMVDRIFGGAKTLALHIEGGNPTLSKIGDYAAVCKAVGYKASQIKDNENFYAVCVALLMDVTDVLVEMFAKLEKHQELDPKEVISQTLIERLKWVSGKFSSDVRETVAIKKNTKLGQNEIDDLLQKLGIS